MSPEHGFEAWDADENAKIEFETEQAWREHEQEVEAEWVEENEQGVQFLTPLDIGEDWEYWNERFIKRQESWKETGEIPNHVHIRLPETSTIALIGDHHVGSGHVDYKRIAAEMDAIIDTPNMYAILLGDTVDGFFWGGEAQMEQMEQPPEQYEYNRAMIRLLGKHGKLLAGFGGDHDGWAQKLGVNAIQNFVNESGGYYMEGLGYIDIYIGDQNYRMALAHKLPGSSIYNNAHPQRRALNEGARDADIIVSGHTHRKGILTQAANDWEGGRVVHMHSVGPYKSGDRFSRKHGWRNQEDDSMFGTAVKLFEGEHHIEDYFDILEAAQNTW